jgi:hypothetical protein
VKITLQHLRKAGYCVRGTKLVCERHGIDWSAAVRAGGIEVERLQHIDDAMIQRLIEVAREQQ